MLRPRHDVLVDLDRNPARRKLEPLEQLGHGRAVGHLLRLAVDDDVHEQALADVQNDRARILERAGGRREVGPAGPAGQRRDMSQVRSV